MKTYDQLNRIFRAELHKQGFACAERYQWGKPPLLDGKPIHDWDRGLAFAIQATEEAERADDPYKQKRTLLHGLAFCTALYFAFSESRFSFWVVWLLL
ncbi:MAG: hypothetical protein HY735_03285 [Verrucomicrobia bacterium]|nr:hypothetical protein [Verrucomicrobiota bacterium]